MERSADYTIQGFLYQFNQTLSEILGAAEDAIVAIEGVVEDIEVKTYAGTKAIQCKYHEAKANYTPSTLYHPILQMMKHFKSNPNAKIHYHIFAHFPNNPDIKITANHIEDVIKSKNKDLKELITDVAGIEIDNFLKVFSTTLTPRYDKLVDENCEKLEAEGFNRHEVQTLVYPNAIQAIAELSIKHDAKLRTITRKKFLDNLRAIKSTAVSQWTLALKTRQKILDARRKQLKETLSINARLRHIVIFPKHLDKFDDEIVLFVKSFIDKYHFKISHTHTPIFAIDVTSPLLDDIAERLIGKDVIPNHGRPVKSFSEAYFFREPMTQKDKKEFALRLIGWSDYRSLDIPVKADDLIAIGGGDISTLDTKDVNVEVLGSGNFSEIKYMMGIANAY